jgi:signal transduction histidine kinase
VPVVTGRGGGSRPPSAALPGDLSETAQAVAIARASDAVMVEVSDGFCALVGRRREEIVGRTADQLGISDRARLDWLIDRFPERGRSHRQRRVFETPDGPRLAELDIHGIEVAGERMIVSVITPVPADEPHGDVEVLAAVLEAAPLGMVLFGPDLRIARVNRAVEQIGTITPEHLGMRLLDAFPTVSADIVAAVERVFADGEPVVGLESTGVDGRSYLLTMFPVRNAVDEVEQVGCMFLDVSDRVSAERALAESEQRRREILASMLQAEEVERSRIATELHDDTVQVMAASLMALDRAALVAAKAGNERMASALGVARATLEEATERTRRLMFELRPAVLHDHGLVAAMRLLAGQVAHEVGATSTVTGPAGRYDLAVEELVYRSAQEALANVRKHARASRITVRIDEHDGVLVGEVADDGRGFDLDDVRSRPGAALHMGLDSMVERVRAAGGDVTIDSEPGAGTRVRFAVPTVLEPPLR